MPKPDHRSREAVAWRPWYNSARWKGPHGRRAQQLKTEPLCRMCQAAGRITVATVADHVIPHKGDADLFWHGELQSLCDASPWRCHSSRKQRLEKRGFETGADAKGRPLDPRHPWNGGDGKWTRELIERRMPSDLKPSAIPLTIVCGPPGSGKSTYIRQHASPDDLIIDLDAIMQRLSGMPEHHTSTAYLKPAMDERNRQLRSLATDTSHPAAWFIVSAPDPSERATWAKRLGGQLVVLDIPLDECIRRIEADPMRRGHTERMVKAATEWWQANG